MTLVDSTSQTAGFMDPIVKIILKENNFSQAICKLKLGKRIMYNLQTFRKSVNKIPYLF